MKSMSVLPLHLFPNLLTVCFLCVFRFYIESISYLKDNATIELFFLNAKSIIYKVKQLLSTSCGSRYVFTLKRPRFKLRFSAAPKIFFKLELCGVQQTEAFPLHFSF